MQAEEGGRPCGEEGEGERGSRMVALIIKAATFQDNLDYFLPVDSFRVVGRSSIASKGPNFLLPTSSTM
jgi:hypothetical protein